MPRLLCYFHQSPADPFWFEYNEDLTYWVCHLRDTKATIPLVSITPDNKFYTDPATGWGILPNQWTKMCEAAQILHLLEDPFRRGEHMEDDSFNSQRNR